MTVQRTVAPAIPGGRRAARAVLEYLGMVVAMFVGMAALGGVRQLLLPTMHLGVDLETVVMLAEMSVGMAVWMAFRRHGRRPIAIMTGAMGLPLLALLPLHWAGVLPGDTLMTAGHLLMLPAMALAMPFAHRSGHAERRAVR